MTVALGESKTCVLANSDIQPKLRLSKTVVNKYGGAATPTDFQASVFDGTGSRNVAWDAFVGFDAGSYVANETTLPGYTASKWSGDCGPDGEITLQPGDEKTCSIMNTQNPPPPPVERALISGRKLYMAYAGPYQGQLVGLAGWEITASLVGAETIQAVTTTDALGQYEFTAADFRGMAIAGASIRVCEEDRKGWVHLTADCVTIRIPYPLPPGWPGAVVDFVNAQEYRGRPATDRALSDVACVGRCYSTATVPMS